MDNIPARCLTTPRFASFSPKMILFGEAHLRRALAAFVAHYNAERPHQGIGNERIQSPTKPPLVDTGEVIADERLGGLLRSYRGVA